MRSVGLVGCQAGEQAHVPVRTVGPLDRLAPNPLQPEAGAQHRPPSSQILSRNRYLEAPEIATTERLVGRGSDCLLEQLGWFGLTEFLVFIGILGVAYVYIWRKGALEWH